MMVTLGIDLACRAPHVASLADGQGRLVWTGRSFQSRARDLEDLWADLACDPGEVTVALEVADEPTPGPLATEEERIGRRSSALAATPAGLFPRTAVATSAIAGYVGTEQYLWGLHRLIDGLNDLDATEPST